MRKLRFPPGPVLLLALLLACSPVAPVLAANGPADTLEQAIELFEDGGFVEAQELLLSIDRSQLTPDQQKRRDDYVSRVQVAITMYEKALRDLEDAETAIAEREYDRAEELLNRVLGNEYAAQAVRRSAQAHLRDVRDRSSLVEETDATAKTQTAPGTPEPMDTGAPVAQEAPPPHAQPQPSVTPTDVERARTLTREADELVRGGRYADAERIYQEALRLVPGYPEAVEGLTIARQHAENVSGVRAASLIERIRREDAINWQRAVAQYRDAERMARDQVLRERFVEANQVLVRATQIVESAKQFADPITKYDNLRSELDNLTKFVRSEERLYHERKVAETRREIEENRARRLRQMEENRARQVDALMQQALQHRKDGDLDAAINVLKQVVVIDPKHAPARWLMDILDDQRQFREARETRKRIYSKSRGALQDAEKAKIPWYEEITYADDWLEILSREGRVKPTASRSDSLLISALDRRVPVDFQREPFEQVIERLADNHRLNLIVNWHDVQRAGVQRDAPIELTLPNEITLKKTLTEVLEQAGEGVVDLGYEVADGVITIATQDFLDRKTYPVVYNISDLLVEIPEFTDAPIMDLRHATQSRPKVSEQADLPWRYGDDDDDEPEPNPKRQSRVRKIIELIQDTVAPQSWRDNGGSIGTIQEINGQLVVTQNSAAHRQLSGLLDKLREERAIQISVETLFITVSSHYLEELGMNLDIILNAGSAGFDYLDAGGGTVLTDPVLGNRLLLPRTFSRLGITPDPLLVGQPLQTSAQQIQQPFAQPYLVPQAGGSSGRSGTPVPVISNILDFTNPASLPSDIPGSFGGQTIGPALSVFGSFLDNIQVDFLIRATQADSRTSVLTAPRLVVFNGASAWIAVTVQQNFISQLTPIAAQQAVAQAPTTGTIDAGASLFVRATVTADRRYVLMLVSPGVTRLLALQTFQFAGGGQAGDAFVQLPTLSAQRINTVVSVPDGGTLLIGGQKLASETEVESGVPILSKIPILKRLYSARALVKDEQVLLILIKPKILIHSEQEELAFPSFRQR